MHDFDHHKINTKSFTVLAPHTIVCSLAPTFHGKQMYEIHK